jgi:hypothetical protein
MKELPKEYLQAWQAQTDFCRRIEATGRPVIKTTFTALADALIWALAGWDRSEFEREHELLDTDHGDYCDLCNYYLHLPDKNQQDDKLDPRHTWSDEQWQQARREQLEER